MHPRLALLPPLLWAYHSWELSLSLDQHWRHVPQSEEFCLQRPKGHPPRSWLLHGGRYKRSFPLYFGRYVSVLKPRILSIYLSPTGALVSSHSLQCVSQPCSWGLLPLMGGPAVGFRGELGWSQCESMELTPPRHATFTRPECEWLWSFF